MRDKKLSSIFFSPVFFSYLSVIIFLSRVFAVLIVTYITRSTAAATLRQRAMRSSNCLKVND